MLLRCGLQSINSPTTPLKAVLHVDCKAVKVRYGLVWVFFGDRERAAERDVPAVPELEGDQPWPCVPVDFTWKAPLDHHRQRQRLHEGVPAPQVPPVTDAKLTDCRTEGDKVYVTYDAKMARGQSTRGSWTTPA